ncbi:TPM domain-containing protein [Hymenobacter ruricola]|uniref:TPM domain-containing protein n=1 Tax=Hymenobacter ruricola TaxID=2791023 RepID=A0ABS0I0R4_9BACT|nr:TPM domain-containing protein [Hymenobacter ruricola]MBF9220538.1 TPM domain-containing protein [Hymenobacter ruricola]
MPKTYPPNTFSVFNVVFGIAGSLFIRFLQAMLVGVLVLLLWWGGRAAYTALTETRAPLAAEPAALPGIVPPRPPRYEPVTDAAALLQPAEEDSLRARLFRFEKATTAQLVIVTVPRLGAEPLEDVAQRLFNTWGIGRRETNNGLLVLVARREHRIRIQTGYGLEGAVPDATAYRLITDVLEPAFKQGKYYVGLDAATAQLMRLMRGEEASFARPAALGGFAAGLTEGMMKGGLFGLWGLLLLWQCRRNGGLIGLWAWTKSDWWLSGSGSGRSRRDWSSGSSGSSSSGSSGSSSSSSWGGGSSGGGGASGGW